MQVHTKATDTPNKFPSVRYSAVGARWYKAIATRRFGVTAFRNGVSCRDISSPISRRVYVNAPGVTQVGIPLFIRKGSFVRVEPRK